jgi:hypothetical protein
MKSKSTQTSSQSQTRDPYSAAIPGLQSAGQGITAWMNNPANAQAYDGQRVADQSGMTSAGIDSMFASTGAKQSQDLLSRTVNGDYLGPSNPYIGQVQDAVRASIMPSINSRISAAGMAPGSSVDQGLVSKELTRGMATPLFNSYEAERGRQMSAAQMLPQISQGIIGNQIGAGQLSEGYQQKELDAARQAWEEQRMAGLRPYAEATPYLTQIGATGGTSNTTGMTTQTSQPSGLQTALGAGMMGASLFSPTGLFGGSGLFGGATTSPGTLANGGWSTTTTPASWFG